jgi:transcriptional regulator with XRE-family HTH domain
LNLIRKEVNRMSKLTINQWMGLKEINGETLASMTGLTESTISNIRSRKVKPSLDSLIKIAESLGIKLDDIEI